MSDGIAHRLELGMPTVKTIGVGTGDRLQPDLVRSYLDELRSLLNALDGEHIWGVVEALLRAYQDGRRIFLLGNGGSAATASHFACDLGKNVPGAGDRRFKVVALTDNVPLLTAWANDTSYERVFAEQLDNLLEAGDAVVGISGSGNSPNVLRAMELARARGATTIGLTGFEGGRLKPLCDVCVWWCHRSEWTRSRIPTSPCTTWSATSCGRCSRRSRSMTTSRSCRGAPCCESAVPGSGWGDQQEPGRLRDEAARVPLSAGALEALAALAASPFTVVVVTNQSAVGRGRMTIDMLDQIHARMLERVRAAGGWIDAIYTCPHRPGTGCFCRKPQTGLLHRAALDLAIELEVSYFVGDAASDVQAALAAGCQPLLVLTGRGPTARAELARKHIRGYWVAGDLLHAVRLIFAREHRGEPRLAAGGPSGDLLGAGWTGAELPPPQWGRTPPGLASGARTCPTPRPASASALAHWRMRRPPRPMLFESCSTTSPEADPGGACPTPQGWAEGPEVELNEGQ